MEVDIAVMLGDYELVNDYLTRGVDVNSKFAKGCAKEISFLNKAIADKHENLVKLFVNKGAKINEKNRIFWVFHPYTKLRSQICLEFVNY